MADQQPAAKVPCKKCGAMILESTSKRNNGLCAPCVQGWPPPEERERRRQEQKRRQIPSPGELAELPRWARVAFAVRCARRAAPALKAAASPLGPQQVASVEQAIALAEHATSTAATPSDAELRSAKSSVEAAAEASGGDEPVTLPAQEPGAMYVSAAVSAADATLALLARPEPDTPPGRLAAAAANMATAACCFAGQPSASGSPVPAKIPVAIRADFERLHQHCQDRECGNDTPISQELLGPLWPDGPPPGWPTADDDL